MSVDPHTEFETKTFVLALLREMFGDSISGGVHSATDPSSERIETLINDFREAAFPHEQELENAEATIAGLPPNFIHTLIHSNLSDTRHKSIIQNSEIFPQTEHFCLEETIFQRVKQLYLTYRVVGHIHCVHQIVVDPNNLMFFTGGDDALIKCWHIPSLSLIATMKGHEEGTRVCGLCMTPDHKMLVSWADNATVRLWSLIDGACVSVISSMGNQPIVDVAVSPCNRYISIASGTGVKIVQITGLIPSLDRAEKFIEKCRGKVSQCTITELLFPVDAEMYNAYDPHAFIQHPPMTVNEVEMKANITSTAWSNGGNILAVGLEDGYVMIITMNSSVRKIAPFQAHEDNQVDGIQFMSNDFHTFVTWSHKSGEVKVWRFLDKVRPFIGPLSVKVAARRAHLVTCVPNCDDSLLFACTSSSLFAWKTDSSCARIMYVDDHPNLHQVSDIRAHPTLPTVFLAVTKSWITIWDVENPQGPLWTLIIPVEMPRFQCACWGPDGISVFASDAQGGVFVFKPAEGPECRTVPEFFGTDYTPSDWYPNKGQLEESNKMPVHMQPRNVLYDLLHGESHTIYEDYMPFSLQELQVCPIYEPAKKYAWLNEIFWLFKSVSGAPGPKPVMNMRMTPPAPAPPPPVANMRIAHLRTELSESSDVEQDDESDTDAKISEPESDSPIRSPGQSEGSDVPYFE